MPLPNLKTLKINGSVEGRDFSSPACSPLATYTTFESNLTRRQLSTLSRQNVKEFVVKDLIDDEADIIIDFPELRFLSITQGGFCTIENIFAPDITDLQIADNRGNTLSRKREISDTIYVLRDRPDNIMLRLIRLALDIPVNTTAVLAILQHWPQLQYFSLSFGNDFAWNTAFPNAFTREKSPVCPGLMTLRLTMTIKNFILKEEQWKKMVMSIYQARRNTRLQTIEWMHCGVGPGAWRWHSVSAEAQDL
jgi:hypothetical protein